jgi:hypothetical protein
MKRTNLFTVLFALSILFVFAAPASAGDLQGSDNDELKCKDAGGEFSAVLVEPPNLRLPVGICTAGRLMGGLVASYEFTMTRWCASIHPVCVHLQWGQRDHHR